MNKSALIGIVIGLIIGVGGTIGISTLVNSKTVDTVSDVNSGSMTMAEMNADLKSKTGDDFDEAFLEMMIEHHQGAIDMANLAATRAKHNEILTLSQAIITAQNREIADMQQWQMDWGYMTNNDSMPGMTH